MRRKVILVTILAGGLAGCGSFRDMFSAHADVAAEAGGRQLPAERLAAIMRANKGARLTRETADFAANAWVDYTLVAQAAATGRLPQDSASIAEVVWPDVAELKGTHWHDTLMARRTTVSDASVDSLYKTSDMRVLQHILFIIRPNSPAADSAAALKKADAALTRIRGGANFGALATELSGDPGSKADSGYLPPSPKGRFVAAFDSAGWSLQPGQVSGLVRTPFGLHILRRPPLDEARPRIRLFLAREAGGRLDSIYMDSLALRTHLKVSKDAPAAMRAALEDPSGSRGSGRELVSYTGGAVTVKDMTRWMRALPPQYLSQVRQADDATLTRFARLIAQNVLLLREADSAGISLSPDEWQQVRTTYESHLDSLKIAMGLDTTDASAADANVAERQEVVGLKVERYFDGLIDGKSRLRPIPSALSTILRERLPYRIYDAGVANALELAVAEKAKADSGESKGGMQRAPGPPPIPGMQPAPGAGGSAAPPRVAPPKSTAPEGASPPGARKP